MSRPLSLLARNDGGNLPGPFFALSHFDQGSSDDSHHVVEETVASDFDCDIPDFSAKNIQAEHRSHCGFPGIAACRLETGKIMGADDQSGRFLHSRKIQRAFYLIAVIAGKDVYFPAVSDDIAVFLSFGIKAGVKICRHFSHIADTHICALASDIHAAAEQIIHCQHNPVRRNAKLSSKRSPLPQSVYASVGAAGPV